MTISATEQTPQINPLRRIGERLNHLPSRGREKIEDMMEERKKRHRRSLYLRFLAAPRFSDDAADVAFELQVKEHLPRLRRELGPTIINGLAFEVVKRWADLTSTDDSGLPGIKIRRAAREMVVGDLLGAVESYTRYGYDKRHPFIYKEVERENLIQQDPHYADIINFLASDFRNQAVIKHLEHKKRTPQERYQYQSALDERNARDDFLKKFRSYAVKIHPATQNGQRIEETGKQRSLGEIYYLIQEIRRPLLLLHEQEVDSGPYDKLNLLDLVLDELVSRSSMFQR